jgi:hypothetical protein
MISIIALVVIIFSFCYVAFYDYREAIGVAIFLSIITFVAFSVIPERKEHIAIPKTNIILMNDGCTMTEYWADVGRSNAVRYVRCHNGKVTTIERKSCGKSCSREESITAETK